MVLIIVFLTLLPFILAENVTIAEEIPKSIYINPSGTLFSNSELTINCVNCSVIGDLSFSGGCDDASATKPRCIEQWAPDANFSMLPVDFTEYWLGIAFDDFHIHIELDIEFTPMNPTNEVTIHLISDSGLNIPFSEDGPFSTVFNFDPQIHGWVNSSTAANFSYRFEFTMPNHSAIWIPVSHLNSISTFGFNGSNLSMTGFESSDPDLQFDFSFAFRPSFSIAADFLGDIFTDNVTFYADLPNIDVSVSQVTDVTSACTASNGTAYTFKNLTHVVPRITTNFDIAVAEPDENWGFDPWNLTANSLPTQCLAWDERSRALVDATSVTSGARRILVAVSPLAGLALVALAFA